MIYTNPPHKLSVTTIIGEATLEPDKPNSRFVIYWSEEGSEKDKLRVIEWCRTEGFIDDIMGLVTRDSEVDKLLSEIEDI